MANLDPFGSALAGYRLGVNDETKLQGAKRKARAVDYDFANNVPLRHQQLQDKTTLANTALPYQQQLLPIGLDRAQNAQFTENLGNADELLRRTGVYQPDLETLSRHFNLTPTYSDNGNVTFNQETPYGLNSVGSMANPGQSLFDYANRGNLLAQLKARAAIQKQQIAAQRAQAYWNYVMGGGARSGSGGSRFSIPGFVDGLYPGQSPYGSAPQSQQYPNPQVVAPPATRDPTDYNAILNGTFWR